MSFSAKVVAVDPDGAQMSQALDIEGAAFGLLAAQAGPPTGVACVAAASGQQYLYLLAAVVEWGLESGIHPAVVMATIRQAMAHHATSQHE